MLRRGSPGILASHNSAGRPRSKKIVTRLLVFQAPTMESAKSIEVGFDAEFLRTRSEVLRAGVFDPDRFKADRFEVEGIRPRLYSVPIPMHLRSHYRGESGV
jgi:hypothetical protein